MVWAEIAEPIQLNRREVHVWSSSLIVDDSRFQFYESCLDEREIARANRYTIEQARRYFVVARGTLKWLLSKYTDTNPTQIRFQLGPKGKPYLHSNDETSLQFNSTDTKHEALFAFCWDAELGIDIELRSRSVRHELIASKKLTPGEFKLYQQCPENIRRQFFLSVWTRKEAYGKAKGFGMYYPMAEIELVRSLKLEPISISDQSGLVWQVIQLEPSPKLTACVVTQGAGFILQRFRLASQL